MKRPLSFLLILGMFVFIFTNILCINAETPEASMGEVIATENAGSESQANDKHSVAADDEEGTGNSTGEIVFMLVIFLGSLAILAEALVSSIKKGRKKKENLDASMDERRR